MAKFGDLPSDHPNLPHFQMVLSQSPAAVNPAGATDQFPTLDQGNPNRFVTQQLMLHWTAQAEGLQITPKIRVTVGTGGPNCTMDNIAALYLGHRT
jgi:hypothetical protein